MFEEITFPAWKIKFRLVQLKKYMPEAKAEIVELGRFLAEWITHFKAKEDDDEKRGRKNKVRKTREAAKMLNTRDFVMLSELAFRDLEDGVEGYSKISSRSAKFYDRLRKNIPAIALAIFKGEKELAREVEMVSYCVTKALREKGGRKRKKRKRRKVKTS